MSQTNDIREQDLALKTTIADTDWIRLVTATGNHRMTVGQFKDLTGYTQLQQKVAYLENELDNANPNWETIWNGQINTGETGINTSGYNDLGLILSTDGNPGPNRAIVIIPNIWNAFYVVYKSPQGIETLRVNLANNTLSILSNSSSSMYLVSIIGK